MMEKYGVNRRLIISAFVIIITATIIVMGVLLSRWMDVSYTTEDYSSSVTSAPIIWVVSAMERIGQHDAASAAQEIVLYAARQEYEPFQVVVRAGGQALTNVNVSFSDLQGPNNQTIPHSNITLYREHYVYVSQASPDLGGTNHPLGKGWYPDALIPFVDPATGEAPLGGSIKAVPFDLPAHTNQPIWVDVFVPDQIEAGQYQGTLSVSSDQGTTQGTLTLNVWDFTLPKQPSFLSSFLFLDIQTPSANELLIRHKVMPLLVEPSDQSQFIDTLGLQMTSTLFWSGAEVNTCTMKPAPSVEEFQEAAAWNDPRLFLYNYTADEIDRCPNLYNDIKTWAQHMHQANIDNLITMSPVAELYDDGSGTGRSAVDIWVLLPKMYDASSERVAEVLAKGDQVWSYAALVQDDYSPKWEIDFAPINFRIQPGFLSQSLRLSGLLYWRVDLWTDDPWQDVQTYIQKEKHYPGEGMLVYPGDAVGIAGVVPSMRLKWIREGIEDYEYIAILKQYSTEAHALEVSRSVGANWAQWTRDPELLETVRRQIGDEIAAAITTRRP